MVQWIWLLLFFFLSNSVWAGQFDQSINSAYHKTMDSYFLKIINAAKKSANTQELVGLVFSTKTLSEKQVGQLHTLADLPTPKVLSIAKGLEFDFGLNGKINVTLSEFYGQITIKEINASSSAVNPWHWFNLIEAAEAQLALLGRGAYFLYRLIVGASVRATATGVAAGAVGGCYVGVETKFSYETLQEACASGALDGASLGSLMSIPFLNNGMENILNGSTTMNPTLVKYLKGFGLLGTVSAIAYSAPALATMNGSLVRCQGDKGDFILSAKIDGATRHTLYEYLDGKIQFFNEKKPGPRIQATEDELVKFSKIFDLYQSLPDEHTKAQSQQVLQELAENRSMCIKKGHGYEHSQSFSIAKRVGSGLEKNHSSGAAK